jgi:23S rRNA (adenine2503-C2)-methyltransferase
MQTELVKIDIRQLELADLQNWFVAQGEQRFRAKQVYEWLWQKGAHDFEEMTNLSKDLRSKLREHFVIYGIKEDKVQYSNDGTIKFRFRLHDGHLIESVLIPVVEDNRFTVCVSSQVGCSLTCSFCATGKMKRVRNLEAAEIYDQVLLVNRVCEQHGHGRALAGLQAGIEIGGADFISARAAYVATQDYG